MDSSRAIALLSGGLDSMLAIRILQNQGIHVEALNFQTVFTCCKDTAAQAARALGVQLTVLGQEDDYVDLIKKPQHGYGKGANPCVDCRIYMFQRAKKFMEDENAQMVISGEVVGQRPMSQKRTDLDLIAHAAGLEDLLLRPLSAKRLRPTRPEREGWVDRDQLYDFCGRSRKGLIALAEEFGFRNIPTPSTGCSLTEKSFAGKVHDLVQVDPSSQRWDFELLNVGRHFRKDEQTKFVVGRNAEENETLNRMWGAPDARSPTLLRPENFKGPTVIVVGPPSPAALEFGCGLILRYANQGMPTPPLVAVRTGGSDRLIEAQESPRAELASTL